MPTRWAMGEEWCKINGEKAITGAKFGRKLTERGFDKDEDRKGRFYIGIGLQTLTDETQGALLDEL